jgi:hypothetical protein
MKTIDLSNKIYVVGYWANVVFVTNDKNQAEAVMISHRQKNSSLPWKVRTVEEAVQHAYRQGLEDAE